MLWSANPPYLAWLAFMTAAYGIFIVSKRWTNAGDNIPLTQSNFGKEQTFLQTLCGFLSNPTAALFVVLAAAAWAARVIIGRWHWLDLVAAATTIAIWPFVEWIVHVAILHSQPRNICGITLDSIFAR